MEQLTCTNKRCNHNFSTCENHKIVKCPVCNMGVYNMEKIITADNILYVQTVIKNLKIYGEEGVFNAIDRNFHKAIQRVRVRKMYANVINELKN